MNYPTFYHIRMISLRCEPYACDGAARSLETHADAACLLLHSVRA